MEIWKDIKGYEGIYQVSNTGKVRSLPHYDSYNHLYRGRELKQSVLPNGYLRVHLSNGKTSKYFSVHRLVAEAFCLKTDGNDIVNHLDCNPKNNNANNLEWTTYKGNMEWAAKLGRMKANHQAYANIEKGREKRKTPLIVTDKDGNKLYFNSQSEAAKSLGISHGHIAAACRKEYGYKTIKGYSFEYANEEKASKAKPKRIAMPIEQRKEKARKRMLGNTIMVGRTLSDSQKLKISKASSKPILKFSKDGDFIAEYPSASFVKKEFGLVVGSCLLGKTKTAGGFIWKFKEKKNE